LVKEERESGGKKKRRCWAEKRKIIYSQFGVKWE
jgi:hypothetical protein